jgi:hypothetical protein
LVEITVAGGVWNETAEKRVAALTVVLTNPAFKVLNHAAGTERRAILDALIQVWSARGGIEAAIRT